MPLLLVRPDARREDIDRLIADAEVVQFDEPLPAEVLEAVADALRRYLEDAEQVPALERTTGELVWALPPHLAAEGLRERALDLFAEADLVKFARVRPDELSASGFTRAARGLLDAWHRTVPTPETSDAVR
jgi:hypothetical protein